MSHYPFSDRALFILDSCAGNAHPGVIDHAHFADASQTFYAKGKTPRRMMLERGAHSNWAKNGVIRDVFWEWIADSMPEESKW